MISSEVQRTLVKSPPELWAELSDPAALTRHLGELGEIRITRVDPEQKVEWEAEHASGTVLIKPSGWGTKVTLTVSREIPEPRLTVPPESMAEPDEQADGGREPAPDPDLDPGATAGSVQQPAAGYAAERRPAPDAAGELGAAGASPREPLTAAQPEPPAQAQSEPADEARGELGDAHGQADEPELEPRRGFFKRLLGRFRRQEVAVQEPPEAVTSAESNSPQGSLIDEEPTPQDSQGLPGARRIFEAHAPLASEAERQLEDVEPLGQGPLQAAELGRPADASPQPADPSQEEPPEQSTEISAGLAAAEEIAGEEVKAVLNSMLDRLGAAHHRPFSRP